MRFEFKSAEALTAAERLRAATASERLLPEETPLTCSFGICTLKEDESHLPTPEGFVQRADKALYEAKRAGRNRVHVFRADPTSSPARSENG